MLKYNPAFNTCSHVEYEQLFEAMRLKHHVNVVFNSPNIARVWWGQ